ncbi:MAG: 4Fe-4S binding protein [Clostridiales Family XIII bacterium]|jgi:dissimilatory sulfite reductase (desulfoviridin) alpha/beta subunit|nr:4Fe-4S binding protein [Clostridiales Family XIII bacterium]
MATDYNALKNAGFMRQVQKGRFSLRLKVVGGNLTAGQIETMASLSRTFGEGYVHLTSRQGVEIPFIRLEDISAVQEALRAGGLDAGACGPRVRTVTACQGSAVCPSGCIETSLLAKEIAERYYGRDLPHKFKLGITGCHNNCLKAEENDIGIKGGYSVRWDSGHCSFCGLCLKACREGTLTLTGDDRAPAATISKGALTPTSDDRAPAAAISKGARHTAGGAIVLDAARCINCGRCAKSCPTKAWRWESIYLLSFGGMFGNRIAKGRSPLPAIHDKETLFRITDAALAFFGTHAHAGERLRTVIERCGWEVFERAVKEAATPSGAVPVRDFP